jgi:hypothetical protein
MNEEATPAAGRRLAVIERPIDNTALSTFMRCPREYNYSMRQGWRRKEKSQALSFGAFWHSLLETHYKSGGDIGAVLQTFAERKHEVPNEGDYRTADRALLEYKRYREVFDVKEDCRATIGWPDAPMVELSTAISHPLLAHEYAGKIDRIISVNGLGYIEDHKTTSRKDKYYFSQYQNSNQMKGYVWIARQLVTDIKIVGVRINLLHCLTNSSSFERHIVTYSDAQMTEWVDNTNRWLQRLERSIVEEDFPGHFGDDGCTRRYGNCPFFNVCGTSPTIRQAVLEQDFHIDHWDPLAYEDTTSDV